MNIAKNHYVLYTEVYSLILIRFHCLFFHKSPELTFAAKSIRIPDKIRIMTSPANICHHKNFLKAFVADTSDILKAVHVHIQRSACILAQGIAYWRVSCTLNANILVGI